jgi:hypothetical protein
MYSPIFEVASARRWKVRPQFPVKVASTTKYIDFVFYGVTNRHDKNDRVAALEISYIRKNANRTKISNDERKLRGVRANDFLNGKFGTVCNDCRKRGALTAILQIEFETGAAIIQRSAFHEPRLDLSIPHEIP